MYNVDDTLDQINCIRSTDHRSHETARNVLVNLVCEIDKNQALLHSQQFLNFKITSALSSTRTEIWMARGETAETFFLSMTARVIKNFHYGDRSLSLSCAQSIVGIILILLFRRIVGSAHQDRSFSSIEINQLPWFRYFVEFNSRSTSATNHKWFINLSI